MRYIEVLSYIKNRIIIMLLVTILSIYINISMLIATAPPNANLSILDTISMQLGGGSINIITLSFPIIPLFCFLILNIVNYDNSELVITRNETRAELWHGQVKLISIIAVIYSAIIIASSYIIGGVLLGDFTNKWRENKGYLFEILSNQESWFRIREVFTVPVTLILIFISLVLGLILIGIAILTLNLKIKSVFAFFAIIAIVFLDVLINNFSYILKNMCISIENLMQPVSILFEKAVLIIGILLIYKIGKVLVKKKDFI